MQKIPSSKMILDLEIFNFINGFAGRWPWLDALGIFCAVYLGYVLLFCLAVFLVKDFKKYWRMVLGALAAALFVRFVLVQSFYLLKFRLRPFVNNNHVNFLISYDPHATAFPSGHASFYFALSTIIYRYHKKAGILFYLASFFIVLGRVFVGVHWPSDVVAGAVVGIVMGLILNKLFRKINFS